MKIVGIQKLTLLDYPGRVACSVFLDGCNFRCPWCHNAELLEGAEPIMALEELLAFLDKRRGILDGVCVTGGEPTIHPELPELLRAIRERGYSVKLDTNGYRPQALEAILKAGLVDYVAMDLKNGPAAYGPTVGLAAPELERIARSIRLLMNAGIPFELRTTVMAPLHDEGTIAEMGRWLNAVTEGEKVPWLFLQPFVDRDTVPMGGFSAPNGGQLERFREILADCAEQVVVRGT